MGRLIGEDNKRSAGHLIRKEAICIHDEHTCRIDHGHDGELPLFFSESSPHLSSQADGLNVEPENRKPGWPLGSRQESGSWASSFRFELDSQDGERLQAMLERDEQISAGEANAGRKLTDRQGTFEGGSFRFIRNEELLSGSPYGHLKSPRQLGSFRFNTVFNANEKQGYDAAAQSGDSLSVVPARIRVAVNDHVPASPRSEVLRRLSDLKAHPLSPRFTPEDAASYQKEKAKIAAVKDDIQQRLKTTVKNEYSRKGRNSSPISQYHCSVLSEQEIMEIKERRRQSFSSPSELRGSPRRAPQSSSPTTPTSRFRDDRSKLYGGCSIQERIVKESLVVVSHINSPSPDRKPVGTPFKWEEHPGKPKTIAAAVDCALARRLSRDGIECMELHDVKSSVGRGNSGKGSGPEASSLDSSIVDHRGRSGSHRYYGREYLRGLARDASLRRSSRRYSGSEKEALIDLDGSAAAKFLVEAFESPSRSHGSSPTFVVPFKWEDAPGKAKVETIAKKPNVLQLPPRLAVPSLSKPESLPKASSPFAGFFLPCLTAGTPVHRDRALVPFTPSKSLPPRLPSPPERRKPRLGLVSRCSSTPREGCQVRLSKSKTSSSEKSLIEPPSTPARKARNMSVSELKSKSNTPSSPTSILCGPEESNSQTSGSNIMFSSGDLEDFTTQTRKSASKSSSSTSYENAEEDFAEFPEAATTTSISAEDTGLLDKQGAPTSSGYLNSKGEPLTVKTLPKQQATNPSPEASPKRPSRLPYTMPEQLLASCSSSGRRQLLQDLSPRLLHQLSGRSHSGANTPYRHLSSEKVVSPSPAYAASLELFSPAGNQKRTPKALVLKSPPPRPRRRIRVMSSILKTLKRALSRKKRRRKRSESGILTYLGGKSPAATFQFKTTYTT